MMAESKIFADGIMGIVDLLTATAGFQIDFDADVINGYSLKLEADDLSISGIHFIKVSQEPDLQFLFSRFWAEFVQYLILNGGLRCIFDFKGFAVIFVIERQNLHALRIVALQKPLVRASCAAPGGRTEFFGAVRVLADDAAALTAHFHIFVELSPEIFHVGSVLFFIDGHESSLKGKLPETHGGEVVLDVVAFLQAEGR